MKTKKFRIQVKPPNCAKYVTYGYYIGYTEKEMNCFIAALFLAGFNPVINNEI